MRVLIGGEISGRVRDAFRARGHRAISCDLRETMRPGPHFRGDMRAMLRLLRWDLFIAFPPCTYLARSGLHHNQRVPGRVAKSLEALEFVAELLGADVPRIALENPIGLISSRIRKPDQIIQPYQFGHDASKATCLWLKNLPLLVPTSNIPPRIVDGKKRWGNQTDSGNNKLPPTPDRADLRSLTFQGIADAMAEQWGALAD
jgi:hypothetical protein